MGDVSKNFSRREFACKCGCGFNAVDVKLLDVLQKTRNYFDAPLIIHCACRCIDHNRSIGSKDTSQHVRGLAADFHIDRFEPQYIARWIDANLLDGTGGIGIYDWGVHVDVRETIARWDHRSTS